MHVPACPPVYLFSASQPRSVDFNKRAVWRVSMTSRIKLYRAAHCTTATRWSRDPTRPPIDLFLSFRRCNPGRSTRFACRLQQNTSREFSYVFVRRIHMRFCVSPAHMCVQDSQNGAKRCECAAQAGCPRCANLITGTSPSFVRSLGPSAWQREVPSRTRGYTLDGPGGRSSRLQGRRWRPSQHHFRRWSSTAGKTLGSRHLGRPPTWYITRPPCAL